jgi:hypothetical protein
MIDNASLDSHEGAFSTGHSQGLIKFVSDHILIRFNGVSIPAKIMPAPQPENTLNPPLDD